MLRHGRARLALYARAGTVSAAKERASQSILHSSSLFAMAETWRTLEEHLIREKLEMGERLLLDSRQQVADRCGFCNPAYFSSVFKKYMHCSPRAYASQPQRWGAQVSATAGAEIQPAR